MRSGVRLKGTFECEIWRPEYRHWMIGGEVKSLRSHDGVCIDKWKITNGITVVGINDMLDEYFGGTGITAYIGLINSVNYNTLSEDDTMSSHSGWEELTDYDEAARQAWGADAASGKSRTNSAKAIFTASTSVNVQGMFVTSDSTKGGTSGVLWCTGLGDVVHQLQPTQELKVTYTLSAQEGV